jgi:acetyl-CoA C-acetyltransferase
MFRSVPLDPRTPVIVGVAQLTRRPERAEAMTSPIEMMAEVVEAAAADAGVPSLARHAQSVQVVDVITWRYENPGRMLAAAIGADPVETLTTTVGGNTPQMLVNDAGRRIQAGELDLVVIAGAEAGATRRAARKLDVPLEWASRPEGEVEPDRRVGSETFPSHEAEMERGIAIPTQLYPIFENAIRHVNGRSVGEHMGVMGTLWSRLSKVAADNPYAWQREAKSVAEIVVPSEDNRMVAFPYTKLLCANLTVDQAAAVIICSAEAAEIAGVPLDQWVFPTAGADANDHWFVSSRPTLHSSPAIHACGESVYSLAGVGREEIAHIDLYSCFPSAVQIAAYELGFGLFERELSVTGGLTFGGGPGNNYTTHAIATVVDLLRRDEGRSHALTTANGWFLTKHSIGVYSNEPPEHGFRWESPQEQVDALPKREVVADYDGEVTVESFTVVHERDGSPGTGFVACLLDDGRRAWGATRDVDEMKALEEGDLIGTRALLSGGTVVLGA